MKFIKPLAIVTILVISSSSSLFVAAMEAPKLWQLTNDVTKEQLKQSSFAEAHVTIDQSVLLQFKPGLKLELPVLSRTVQVQIKGSRQQGSTLIWSAANQSPLKLPDVQLFIRDGKLSAWIPTAVGTFRLHNGRLIKEYKMGGKKPDYKLPPDISSDSTLLSSSSMRNRAIGNKESNEQAPHTSAYTQPAQGDLNIKVLFVLTDEFIQSHENYEDKITEYVVANNAIYEASGMNIQIRVAEIIQAGLENFSADQILDNLSSNPGDDSTDGDIPDSLLSPIWQARVASAADFIVVMLNDLPEGLCGQGWLNGNSNQSFNFNFAVNVTAAFTTFGETSQFCGYDTLGHELGHNMGLGHSLRQGSEGKVFTFGRGYGVVDEFTTVMAYPSEFGSASGVALYSSPDLTCQENLACGVNREQSDGADAVYAVNQVKEEISLIYNEAVTLPIADALADLAPDLQNCINKNYPEILVNSQVSAVNCSSVEVSSYAGIEQFPALEYISLAASSPDLTPFENLQRVDVLDFRASPVTNLRPVSHLKDILRFLQFSAVDMSCQDVKVVESWGVEQLFALNGSNFCNSLSSDDEDFDGDGITNLNDTDDDNDGLDDITDHAPFDSSNADDIDNDGVPDASDAFPYNENESVDTDSDTVGNNQDTDDDNDGVPDTEDCAPLDNTLSQNCGGDQDGGDGDTGGDTGGDGGGQNDSDQDRLFVAYDYDGDGKADVGVRRASTYLQYILNSSDNEIQRVQFGRDSGDISVSGDFDGDLVADVAVRRPATQFWYILNSSNGEIQRFNFGLQAEDIPVPADYDGDGKTDIAVRRPSTQFWYILNSSDGEIQRYNFGLQSEDIPVPADYDGDGKADIAVRRPSNQFWYILNSSDGEIQRYNFGRQSEDIPVPADYDGDGKADIAVRRPSTQLWYILNSSDGEIQRIRFGLQAGDIPIPADYDGDGKADVAVRRPSTQLQYILRSSDGDIERIQFGRDSADMPLAGPVMTRFDAVVSEASAARDHQGLQELSVSRERISFAQALADQVVE